MAEGRKRRKWDVAAPEGIPIATAASAGRGGIGTTSATHIAAGVITAQGPMPAAAPVNIHAAVPAQFRLGATAQASGSAPFAAAKPGAPLDEETRARARQGAAAIVAKINQARRPGLNFLCYLIRSEDYLKAWQEKSANVCEVLPASSVEQLLKTAISLGRGWCACRGQHASVRAQELMAQGKVPAGMHALMPGGRAGGERQEAGTDVSINDAPPDTRHFLTRRPTQARPAAQRCLLSQPGERVAAGALSALVTRAQLL